MVDVVVVGVLVVVDVVVVEGVSILGSTNSPLSSSSKPIFFKALPILETFLSSRRTSWNNLDLNRITSFSSQPTEREMTNTWQTKSNKMK